MQRVDRHIHGVLVAVDNLNHLLHHVALGNAHQSSETSHTVVDVHHVVANLKLLYLFQRQRHFASVGLVALKAVLVEAVKYLVVCEEAYLQCVVDKAFVNGSVDRREVNSVRFRLCHLLKDVLQSGYLLLAVGKDTYLVALVDEPVELLAH